MLNYITLSTFTIIGQILTIVRKKCVVRILSRVDTKLVYSGKFLHNIYIL